MILFNNESIYLKRIPEKWYPGKFDILVKLIKLINFLIRVKATIYGILQY